MKTAIQRRPGRPSTKKQIDITRVLEISIQSFSNLGFDGTQMKTIADEAGYSKSLMNYHFGNKENLWKQSILHLGSKLKQRLEEVHSYFKDLNGLAAVKAYTRQFIYFSAEHPELYKLVFHEMCTKTDRASWLMDNILKPIHTQFEMESKALDTEGELVFKDLPVANFSSIMIGAANVFFIHAFQMEKMYGIDPNKKSEIEKHADIVIDLLFAKFQQ